MKSIEKEIMRYIGECTVKLWEYDFEIVRIKNEPEISTEDYNEIYSKIAREQNELKEDLRKIKKIFEESYKNVWYR